MNTDILNSQLNVMWKNGTIDKASIPFIKTAINRPLWAFWHIFTLRALAHKDAKILVAGFGFLKYRYRDDVLMFLKKYFPGLIVFNFFEEAWSNGNNSSTVDYFTPPDNVRPFDKTASS
jgi:hypothetical protein